MTMPHRSRKVQVYRLTMTVDFAAKFGRTAVCIADQLATAVELTGKLAGLELRLTQQVLKDRRTGRIIVQRKQK